MAHNDPWKNLRALSREEYERAMRGYEQMAAASGQPVPPAMSYDEMRRSLDG